ncbi:MAG: methylated-DNA--[protein]-cysteine S-methyltransferase [Devosiaceae bacterium]|nr:methylated-DNA--[protein]-cysteine S-methyltransferase [Devosiaceae bacterium]
MENYLKEQSEDYQIVQQAIAYLSKNNASNVDLENFAHALGLNERLLVALFKRWCGLSPKSFMQAVALDHAKKLLKQNASILTTSNEVGLSSTSRLYDLFVTHHAMPPGAWANRGEGLNMIWGIAPSIFGNAMLFITDYGLAGLAFFDDGEEKKTYLDMANRWPKAKFERNDLQIAPYATKIFDKNKWKKSDPIKIIFIGTDFEIRCWQGLLSIPMGSAITYGTLAKNIKKPKAARAVGAAIGRNPISFIVPCHRVVGQSGKLTGYHWGLNRKRAMLGWESGANS